VQVRYGISISTPGGYAEPGRVVEAATAAEEAWWEGLFVWDHLAYVWDVPSAEPWVVVGVRAAMLDDSERRLEKLSGDRTGKHSIRINKQWRICFRRTDAGPEDVWIVDHH